MSRNGRTLTLRYAQIEKVTRDRGPIENNMLFIVLQKMECFGSYYLAETVPFDVSNVASFGWLAIYLHRKP